MAGLFDTLNIGSRSLQAQRHGVDVAGHNLGNVNTAGYARQRVDLAAITTVSDFTGYLGAGADVVAIQNIRDAILDNQVQSERSITGSLEAQEKALQSALTALNDGVQRTGSVADGVTTGLGRTLNDLFAKFQGLATSPVSTPDRQALLTSAQAVADQLHQVDQRLARVESSLDEELKSGVAQANSLLDQISRLNENIVHAELRKPGSALDLRDARQLKIEELAKILPLNVTHQENGAVSLAVQGSTILRFNEPVVHLEVNAAANGPLLPNLAGQSEPLQLTSGAIHGVLEARDSAVKGLRDDINALASTLISEVNAVHERGFSTTGSTGAPFFTGTNASDIAINPALLNNPGLIQGSSSATETGDNKVLLELAALANKALPALAGKTFSQGYSAILSGAGQSLSSASSQLENQNAVETLLKTQRDSISGVSIDEEVTNLVKFQKAFQASARFITVTDELLETIVNLT